VGPELADKPQVTRAHDDVACDSCRCYRGCAS
jgi:hypothetical protein